VKARTAAQPYKEEIATVRANLTAITEALEQHVAETGCNIHWGCVGDLQYLNECLETARRFIRQEEK